MRALVTGASGQLGRDAAEELRLRGCEVIALSHRELDITDRAAVQKLISASRPDAVIHCAAYTAVDAAESDVEKCFSVNASGTENIAAACQEAGAKLIYVSTDYVFDGSGETPWTPEAAPGPLNVYGGSKLAGERLAAAACGRLFIVRTSWLFGEHGSNFIKTILRLAESGKTLSVVSDQIGRPTYSKDLARLLCDMADSEKYGVYHACGSGDDASRFEIASEAVKIAGLTAAGLQAVTTAEYGAAPAARPLNSRLDVSKLAQNGFEPLPDWRDAAKRYIKAIGGLRHGQA